MNLQKRKFCFSIGARKWRIEVPIEFFIKIFIPIWIDIQQKVMDRAEIETATYGVKTERSSDWATEQDVKKECK